MLRVKLLGERRFLGRGDVVANRRIEGGQLGADWHLRARHFSIGLLAGVRHYPSLEGLVGGAPAIGIHGTAYIRYVF